MEFLINNYFNPNGKENRKELPKEYCNEEGCLTDEALDILKAYETNNIMPSDISSEEFIKMRDHLWGIEKFAPGCFQCQKRYNEKYSKESNNKKYSSET